MNWSESTFRFNNIIIASTTQVFHLHSSLRISQPWFCKDFCISCVLHVYKYELNCEYCNITLARNKAPWWWWSEKIETCRSVLSVLKVFYVKLYVHSLVNELKWFCKNARCYSKVYRNVDSLPHSQKPLSPVPIPSQINLVHFPISFLNILNLSSHLHKGLPNDLFPSDFPTKTLYSSYKYKQYIVKHNSINDFIKVYFLQCFFQRHVSAVVMSNLQVDCFS